MGMLEQVKMLVRYRAWADELTFKAVMDLPEGEAVKPRPTRFGSMVHTLNHVFVIDAIFKAHLLGEPHHYTARNTETSPPLGELWQQQRQMNQWYIDYVEGLSEDQLNEWVSFQFVGGGEGGMSRHQIITHIVNHGTYHRGFVGDMMYQVPATPPANDFPVYLRDVVNTAG